MTLEEVNAVIDHLMHIMWDLDREQSEALAMRGATQAIQAWQRDGSQGQIPHLDELIGWGVPLPAAAHQNTATAPPPALPAAPTTTPLHPAGAPEEAGAPPPDEALDPDDALQEEYERALAQLVDEKFHTAMRGFAALSQRAAGRLVGDVARYFDEARTRLDDQVRPLIAEAQAYAAANPDDVAGQRTRWAAIRVKDPDNSTVSAALTQLSDSAEEAAVRQEMADIRRDARTAVENKRLMDLELARTLATSLRARYGGNPRLSVELNRVIDEVEEWRGELRTRLGRPSTLVVGDSRQAYKEVRALRNENVAHLVDEANIAGEGAKATVGAYQMAEVIRAKFLSDLKDLVAQRQTAAATQKKSDPDLALKTLDEALGRLEEELLTEDDKAQLELLTQSVRDERASVLGALEKYNKAKEKVEEASNPKTNPRVSFDLLVAAQEIYPDYPGLDGKLAGARDGIAVDEARELGDKMTDARRLLDKNDFTGALQLLKDARKVAKTAVPYPKEDSPLAQSLKEVSTLEDRILEAEKSYLQLMDQLKDIAALMDAFEADTTNAKPLRDARAMMADLTEEEQKQPAARKLLVRLGQLQTVGDNWLQGQSAYHRGQWDNAIDLLGLVAREKEVKESAEAERLVKRAEGARDVLLAQEDEIARRFVQALGNYESAGEAFAAFEADSRTAEFQVKARDGLARMQRKANNDSEVSAALIAAERTLLELKARVAGRQGVAEQVQPIDDYKQVIDSLTKALAIDSTLKNNVEAQRSLARRAWLDAYRGGMEAARSSKDLIILEQAKSLGRELEENGLLTAPDDKELYQQLEEDWLDAQWSRLKRPSNVDWQAIEKNRQRRREISGDSPLIIKQVTEAAENRVLARLVELSSRRRLSKSRESPLSYLRGELGANPDLWGNQRLVAKLMELLWQKQEWLPAETYAKNLANRALPHARDLSRIWQGLNRGAEKLYERDDRAFTAEMSRLEEILSGHEAERDLRPIFEQQRDELIDNAAEKLVQEAQRRARQGAQDDIVAATSLYALILRIDPDNAQAAADLADLRSQLQSIIANESRNASSLAPTVPLKQTVSDAKALLVLLHNMAAVAKQAKLDEKITNSLNNDLSDLETKVQNWDEMQKQLEQIDYEVHRFKTEPTAIGLDGSGGWDPQRPQRQYSAAQQKAQASGLSGESAIQTELVNRKRNLDALNTTASNLARLARTLLQAVDNEWFEQVDKAADELDAAWVVAMGLGFDGLDNALYREDRYSKEPINGTAGHRRNAKRQQANYDLWHKWANRIVDDYKAVEEKARFLKQDLDALRQDKPLEELRKECDEVLQRCEAFRLALNSEPRVQPISTKALGERNRYSPAWNDDIEGESDDSGIRHRAHNLLAEINIAEQKLKPELKRLNQIMGTLRTVSQPQPSGLFHQLQPPDARIVRTWLGNAREQLQVCLVLDPLHFDIQQAKREIAKIADKFP